jgi:hypothetical protein
MTNEAPRTNLMEFIPNCFLKNGCGEHWQGEAGSGSPLGGRNPKEDSTIEDKELLRIIVERLAYRQNPNINGNPTLSSVFGQPDFLPFPFLGLGLKRGAAVCRILREFKSEEGAENLIASLLHVQSEQGWRKGKPFLKEELAEICCISPDQVGEIFEIPSNFVDGDLIQLQPRFFRENLKVIPYATGFLVSRVKLLTNYHILPLTNKGMVNEDLITEYIAEFNYEQDDLGREVEPVQYRFAKVVVSDPYLDFALIQLEQEPIDEKHASAEVAGDRFGWITLLDNDSVIAPPLAKVGVDLQDADFQNIINQITPTSEGGLKTSISKEALEKLRISNPSDGNLLKLLQDKAVNGDPVNIVQHPKGRFKEVVLSDNRVRELKENFIFYEADTDFSSSGSPVFNQQWQLVGLHIGAVAGAEEQKSNSTEVKMQVGVRTSKIVEFLVKELKELIDKHSTITDQLEKVKNKIRTIELWFFINQFVQLNLLVPETPPEFDWFDELITRETPRSIVFEALALKSKFRQLF